MWSSVDEVTLDLDAEFKLLGATSANGIPVVENTQYQSKVDVDDRRMGRVGGPDVGAGSQDHHRASDYQPHSASAQHHHHQGSGRDADRAEAARDHRTAIGYAGLEGLGG